MTRTLTLLALPFLLLGCADSLQSATITGPNTASVGETVTIMVTGKLHSTPGEESLLVFQSYETPMLLSEPVMRIEAMSGVTSTLSSRSEPMAYDDRFGWNETLAFEHIERVADVTLSVELTCIAVGELLSNNASIFGVGFYYSDNDSAGNWHKEIHSFSCTE